MTPQLLDVVALLSDLPTQGLLRGQVGTIVELLDGAYEVEFSDDVGKAYAEVALEPALGWAARTRAMKGSLIRPSPGQELRLEGTQPD